MATTATVTIGSDTFIVYSLTADSNVDVTAFWNLRLGADADAWVAASTADQDRATVMAADWIDRALTFTGTKTVSTQDREWPRDNAQDCGTTVTSNTTPDEIFYAEAWLAGAILVDNTSSASGGVGSNIRKVGAGSASVQFFVPTEGTASDVRLPQVAHDYTKCFTEAATSSGIGGPTSSGTSTSSSFCDDDFGFNEGLS